MSLRASSILGLKWVMIFVVFVFPSMLNNKKCAQTQLGTQTEWWLWTELRIYHGVRSDGLGCLCWQLFTYIWINTDMVTYTSHRKCDALLNHSHVQHVSWFLHWRAIITHSRVDVLRRSCHPVSQNHTLTSRRAWGNMVAHVSSPWPRPCGAHPGPGSAPPAHWFAMHLTP